jgi:hypothetical protein
MGAVSRRDTLCPAFVASNLSELKTATLLFPLHIENFFQSQHCTAKTDQASVGGCPDLLQLPTAGIGTAVRLLSTILRRKCLLFFCSIDHPLVSVHVSAAESSEIVVEIMVNDTPVG